MAPVTLPDMTPSSPRPGDLLLDRYLPEATPREREEEHQNLRRFAKTLLFQLRFTGLGFGR